MHVLPGKFLELVRMKQDPLRVLPKAQFPHRWHGPRTLKKRGFVCPNLSSRAGELDPMHGSRGVVRIAKLCMQQVLFCIDARKQRRNKQ
jgi:hypothetical protein